MELKQWRGFCLCRDASLGDCVFPPEAEAVRAPFAPLVFLVRRDGLKSRGHFAIDNLSELIRRIPPLFCPRRRGRFHRSWRRCGRLSAHTAHPC